MSCIIPNPFLLKQHLPMSLPRLNILSVSAVTKGLRHAVAAFQKDTSIQCQVHYLTSPKIRELVWPSHDFDVVITTKNLVRELTPLAPLEPTPLVQLGGMGLGLVVAKESSLACPSGRDEFIQLLQHAQLLVFNQATSGQHVKALLEKLGLWEPLHFKIRPVLEGQALLNTLSIDAANPSLILGIGTISEILELKNWGYQLLSPMPEEFQIITHYQAAICTLSANQLEAEAFLRTLQTPPIKALFHSSGFV
jgi:ABC-type molybdate transport system substrate-binding protein